MFDFLRWHAPRRAALAALVATATLASGCRDDSTVRDAGAPRADAEMTGPADVEMAASRGGDRLRRYNRQAWVGNAHNKAMDDFRKEMRQAGVLSRNICEHVLNFSMSAARAPAGRAFPEGVNWRAVRAVSDSSSLCGAVGRPRLSNISLRSPLEPLSPSLAVPQSADAVALYSEIETALWNARDASDLANRLTYVLDKSARLPSPEQEAVGATIAVTQDSYEYWHQQYPGFEQEVIAEYGPCIEQYVSYGMVGDPIGECVTGKGGVGAVSAREQQSGKVQQLVTIRPRAMCPGGMARARKVAYADATGAFKGAIAGGLAGGIEGAVLGALAGGAAGSILAAIENAIEVLKCIYGLT